MNADELIVAVRVELDRREARTRELHARICGHDAVDADAARDCDWHVSSMLALLSSYRELLDAYEKQLRLREENSAAFVRESKAPDYSFDPARFASIKSQGWLLAGRVEALREAVEILARGLGVTTEESS